jgi:hypothetical protein
MNREKRSAILLLALFVCLAGCSGKSSSGTSGGGSGSETSGTAAPAAQPQPPPPPPPPPIVIPAGMLLTINLQQAVSSKTNNDGDPFTGTLANAIVINGDTVIPKGASASGTVTQAHAAGKFKGAATLALRLESVEINGQPFAIQTTAFSQQSKGKGKRTAVMIGGGTGGGALIGGLAGGGKGALIGGLIGAGAGTAGAAFTGNRDIQLPVESAVSFKLTQPLSVPVAAP